MKVRDIMTGNPVCCTADTNLREVAHLMVEQDCGEIPVIGSLQMRDPVGVVTDRDIVCRAVAEGKNPLGLPAREVMTSPAITIHPDADAEDCGALMEQYQVRRLPVVDDDGRCCGIVALADIARKARAKEVAEVIREVSQPSSGPSNVVAS